MFQQPTKRDIDYALSTLMHEARRQIADEKNRVTSDAITHGALQGNRVIVIIADAADKLHVSGLTQAKLILLDFVQRMERPASEVIAWARPHLENLSNVLLAGIPPNGFPDDHQRILNQYQAVFQQRVDGTLREVEIGYVRGSGFSAKPESADQESWVSAAHAVTLLGRGSTFTISKRAHAGLIRARAERFIRDSRAVDNAEVPREFWWAEGYDALHQNWKTGDFDTWIDQRIHLQAFGVTFLRADIERLVSSGPAQKSSASTVPLGTTADGPTAIILTALNVETRAALRHLTNVRERPVRGGTIFHVGRFGQWAVAVAECGDGNVHAAATIERGINEFNPEVALFVGVAGGVKDVVIGDVVVSSKVYSYERGKDNDDGFKPRPTVTLPDYALEQRVRAVRLKNIWQERLNPELQHLRPKIYVGAIAAGEKVVASSAGKIALFLQAQYGDTLAVEMEGYGFLTGVHINAPVQGCVVRGISDLLDGKASADKAGSQEKAADVASAVAFEMLATLPSDRNKEHEDSDGSRTNSSHHIADKNDGREETAKGYFTPELARIMARQVQILDRAVANFITASVGEHPLPGDSWGSLKPSQPVHYPHAVEFRNLSPKDAKCLIEVYDSLQEIVDTISRWIETSTPSDVDAWNSLMQMVASNLRLGQKAVQRVCPDRQYSATIPAAGTLLDRMTNAIFGAEAALKAHLGRHGVA